MSLGAKPAAGAKFGGNMEKVRGKFRCDSKTETYYNKDMRIIKFNAVCNDGTPENERYHRYTPSGQLEMTVDNPSAAEFFELGKSYYLDFIKAE